MVRYGLSAPREPLHHRVEMQIPMKGWMNLAFFHLSVLPWDVTLASSKGCGCEDSL